MTQANDRRAGKGSHLLDSGAGAVAARQPSRTPIITAETFLGL